MTRQEAEEKLWQSLAALPGGNRAGEAVFIDRLIAALEALGLLTFDQAAPQDKPDQPPGKPDKPGKPDEAPLQPSEQPPQPPGGGTPYV